MQCAFCKEMIDDDSFFCDMCGEEIKICPGCKKNGKGKICTACGTALTTLKTLNNFSLNATTQISPLNSSPPPPVHTCGTPAAASTASESTYRLPDESPFNPDIPQLRLLNKNINVDLKIDADTILGRTTGPYISIFGPFNQVSGKHCHFSYNPIQGWCVTDLGSTNKTRFNNQVLVPSVPQSLADQNYLKIANIEFFVRIFPNGQGRKT